MSVYIDNFLLILNIMGTVKLLKQLLAKKYNMKNIGKVKTIIGSQITRDFAMGTMKIDQSAFIRNLVIKEDLTNCNTSIILIKAGLSIKMLDLDDNKETDFHEYQYLIG